MKKRGLASPDLADALALTFAYPVTAHDHRWQLTGKPRHQYQMTHSIRPGPDGRDGNASETEIKAAAV